MLYSLYLYESTTITKIYLKFIYGDGPNLCGVKIVDVSSTFIEDQWGLDRKYAGQMLKEIFIKKIAYYNTTILQY